MKGPSPHAIQNVIDRLILAGENGWRPPNRPVTTTPADDGNHAWELRAWRPDRNEYYYLWHCTACGRGVTNKAYIITPPTRKDLADLRIPDDCRQSTVEMVHGQ